MFIFTTLALFITLFYSYELLLNALAPCADILRINAVSTIILRTYNTTRTLYYFNVRARSSTDFGQYFSYVKVTCY